MSRGSKEEHVGYDLSQLIHVKALSVIPNFKFRLNCQGLHVQGPKMPYCENAGARRAQGKALRAGSRDKP